MNRDALLVEDSNRSARTTTTFERASVISPWFNPVFWVIGPGDDMHTARVFFTTSRLLEAFATVVSSKLSYFPQISQVAGPDLWIDVDVYFPPKKTRTVRGKVVRRARATFMTAFADELGENTGES